MSLRSLAKWVLGFWLMWGSAAVAVAADRPPVSLGDGTYRISRSADSALIRDAKPYVYQVKEDAEKFCAGLGKGMKVVSISESKGSLVMGRFAEATLVFKPLDPNDPELARELRNGAVRGPMSATDQASKDLETLSDLHRRGILTAAEFETAKNRVAIAATGK